MARELKVEIVGDATSYTRSLKRAEAGTTRFNREISRTTRGVAAGSGAFRSLGRSLAFASGGFIAAASITDVLRGSIEQATQAAAAQRQLSAQFTAAGQNLGTYQAQIDATIRSLSELAGIEDDQVKQAFTLAFRATQDVTQGLRLTTIAADVARGRNISLAQATIALNKAYGGNVGALRRLGITIPKTLTGMKALEFVAGRFAGQAEAGTTAQQRFNAAFLNFQEILGAKLLPQLNKFLEGMTAWLNDSDNQKRAAHDMAGAVHALGDAWAVAAAGVKLYQKASGFLSGTPGPLGTAFKVLLQPGFGLSQLAKVVRAIQGGGGGGAGFAGGTEDRRFGRAPGGAGAFQPIIPGAAGTGTGALGFNARFARLELALTKAERTIQQRDNRAILVQEAALIRQRISKVKNMKDLLKLNQNLTQVVQQIQQIDDEQRQKEDDARQKELDARKKAADKARAHAAKLKAQAAAVKAQLQSALDSAITQMGQLFDVFVPDDPAKGILGVVGGGVSAKSLTAKLKAQTDQVVAFNRDLNRLAKRGAPPALIASLRAEGLAGAQNVHALATAGRGDLNTFLRQYARRQRVAQQIAHADIRARNVYINGNIRRTATTPTSQRRGRNAGVIDAAMTAGAGSPWS